MDSLPRSLAVIALAAATEAATPLAVHGQGELTLAKRFFSTAAESLRRIDPSLKVEFGKQFESGWLDLSAGVTVHLDPADRRRDRFDATASASSRGAMHVVAGLRKVSWGVLESADLVDVINQRDSDARWPSRATLGQPMIGGSWLSTWGTLELYLLPWARPRPFSGRRGLLWSEYEVLDSAHRYRDSALLSRHAALATRWSLSASSWQVGLSMFTGTGRDPQFTLDRAGGLDPGWIPVYDRIRQIGLDAQYTEALWLGKLEVVVRDATNGRHVAFGMGLELAPTDYLSVFGEVLYDSRGKDGTTSLEHDAFAGARLLFQDGSAVAGVFIDLVTANSTGCIMIERRLLNDLAVRLELRAFAGASAKEPPLALREQTSLSITLRRFF